jgi:AraC-like DNA-binding protein
MLAVPIPFVVALILALMLALLLRRDEEARPSWALVAFLCMAMLQSILVGLRWSYEIPAVRVVLPITASTLPPLAWMSVDELRRAKRGVAIRWLLPAAIVGVMSLLMAFCRQAIDWFLLSTELIYGFAILNVARKSPDGLDLARLGDASSAQKAILGLGCMLIGGGIVDIFVAVGMEGNSRAAGLIISIGDLFVLSGVVGATMLIGWSRSAGGPAASAIALDLPGDLVDRHDDTRVRDAARTGDVVDEMAVLAVVDSLLGDRALYRDADLSLDRLARRAGLPARTLSMAINRVHGMNVSQYVNRFRVTEAQDRLRETDRPVTAILFEVGFQTKSNFNREFRRLVGCSPKEWRQKEQGGSREDV